MDDPARPLQADHAWRADQPVLLPLRHRFEGRHLAGQARPGRRLFCVQHERFVLQNRNFQKDNTLDCAARNLQTKQFFIVNTKGAPNHVHNLTD